MINLKRFSQAGFTFLKNSKKIVFPPILKMDDFMIHMVDKNDEELVKKYREAKDKDGRWESRY